MSYKIPFRYSELFYNIIYAFTAITIIFLTAITTLQATGWFDKQPINVLHDDGLETRPSIISDNANKVVATQFIQPATNDQLRNVSEIFKIAKIEIPKLTFDQCKLINKLTIDSKIAYYQTRQHYIKVGQKAAVAKIANGLFEVVSDKYVAPQTQTDIEQFTVVTSEKSKAGIVRKIATVRFNDGDEEFDKAVMQVHDSELQMASIINDIIK